MEDDQQIVEQHAIEKTTQGIDYNALAAETISDQVDHTKPTYDCDFSKYNHMANKYTSRIEKLLST